MNTELADKITNKKLKNHKLIQHKTVNFVDDHTNVIAGHNLKHIQDYTTEYGTLINNYYTINKLLINPKETKLIVTCKPSQRRNDGILSMQTNEYTIKQSKNIKILGVYFDSDLTHTFHINKKVSNLYYRLHTLNKLKNNTNFQTRKSINNAKIIGTLNYALPTLINLSPVNLKKYHKKLMKTARQTLGHYGFKQIIPTILNRCRWSNIALISFLIQQ